MSGKVWGSGKFRFKDFLVIVIFLSIAATSIELFRRDLLQTFSLQNVEPVGVVVVKKNTVQRRLSDRVLWDRLSNESPVYIGDLIRVADLSSASLFIENNSIELIENTLIRIIRGVDNEGIQIVLSEGNLSLAAGDEASSLLIDMMGQQVQTVAGAVINLSIETDGSYSVQVNEGSVQIMDQAGLVQEISSGELINIDAEGRQRLESAVVVTAPRPSARYVNRDAGGLPVNFSWNRINLEADAGLTLETSSERNFSNVSQRIDNLNNQTQVNIGAGEWYWRISYNDEILSAGNLTIADGTGPMLLSPAYNSVFRFQDTFPVINFQWAEVSEAISYIIEVSESAEFLNPLIRERSPSASYVCPVPGTGTWFWRVTPVFPEIYIGAASFSETLFFSIERSENPPEEVSISQWLAMEAPPDVLPEGLPEEFYPEPVVEEPPPPPPPPPPPRLASPRSLLPLNATRFGFEELRMQRTIDFTWAVVPEANAYNFILYQQTASGRRQIVNTTLNTPRYTLTNLQLLDRGTFIWQVEPINIGAGSMINRRGNIVENTFVIDFPAPLPIQIDETGILYGN